MALERLDPIEQHNKMILDHYVRYYLASQFVEGKRVLDIACGLGYGSKILVNHQAKHVTGCDISGEAISYANTHYAHERITYQLKDIFSVNKDDIGTFDVVVSFETIEHVKEPEKAIHNLFNLLSDNGILVVSIPNDIDLGVNNPYHLSKFTQDSFMEMLQRFFKYIVPLYQNYTVGSMIWSLDPDLHTPGMHFSTIRPSSFESYQLGDPNDDRTHVDCFLAICSQESRPSARSIMMQSPWVWRSHNAEIAQVIDTVWNDSQRLAHNWEEHVATIETQQHFIADLEQALKNQQQVIDNLEQSFNNSFTEAQRLSESWQIHVAQIEELKNHIHIVETNFDSLWNELQQVSKELKDKQQDIDRFEEEFKFQISFRRSIRSFIQMLSKWFKRST